MASANGDVLQYLAPVFSVAHPKMKPVTATAFAIVMCLLDVSMNVSNSLLAKHLGQPTNQVRSLNLPEDQDQAIDITPAIRYGGQVSTKVIF